VTGPGQTRRTVLVTLFYALFFKFIFEQITSSSIFFFKNSIIVFYSVAVDFAKNGVSAPRLTRDLRPQEYPHYMEKRDKKSRKSTTILGILYDKIEDDKTDLYMSKEEEIHMASSFPYKSFIIDGIDKNIMKEARNMKIEYDRDVKRVMRQYGIKHEVEIVSGYILRFTSKQYAKETKLFELRNEISYAYRVIQDKYVLFLMKWSRNSLFLLDIYVYFGNNFINQQQMK